MKEYEIHLNDWARILAGDVPAAFYGELIFRATYLFILLIICMRLLGKRMAAQLSRSDLAAMASLAAAIGVPFVAPERGLLPSTIIAVIVVSLTSLSARLNFRRKKFEKLTIGDVSSLVEDGVINLKNMHAIRLPKERVISHLRTERILHLGEVKRLYMESSGDFSLVKQPEVSPGLLVLPSDDTEFVDKMVDLTDDEACAECGSLRKEAFGASGRGCQKCGNSKFVKAVIAKE